MYEGCDRLRAVIQRPEGGIGAGRLSLIERFLAQCRKLFQGSTDVDADKRKAHPHVEKINRLSGLFQHGKLQAGIYAVIDLWEQAYNEFFQFAKSPSEFGNFDAPHLRHMIAEQVACDKIFYRNMRADPVR